MRFHGPEPRIAADAERILRSLPQWFGIEDSLQEYVRDSEAMPTFAASDDDGIVGFLTAKEHFPGAWEVHCLAVHAAWRNRGVGRGLHLHVEQWLAARGVRMLQVKTLGPSRASAAYDQTRGFYTALGYQPLEEFPLLWGPGLPVLQLVKMLSGGCDNFRPDRSSTP